MSNELKEWIADQKQQYINVWELREWIAKNADEYSELSSNDLLDFIINNSLYFDLKGTDDIL